jgi:uncharacterized RDD family membrane protein YckC
LLPGASVGDIAAAPLQAAASFAPVVAVSAGPRYAGFWMRFLASVIDAFILQVGVLLIAIPVAIGFGVAIAAGRAGNEEAIGGAVFFVLAVVSTVAQWVYEAGFTSSTRRATPGKMALGIVVTDEPGNRLSFARASGRHFAKYLSSMTFLIGFLIQPFTAKRQALHDLVAGTIVTRA